MSKTVVNIASGLGLFILIVLSIVLEITLRWHNPDMTETRLFLTYWKYYVSIFVLFLVFAVTYSATTD